MITLSLIVAIRVKRWDKLTGGKLDRYEGSILVGSIQIQGSENTPSTE